MKAYRNRIQINALQWSAEWKPRSILPYIAPIIQVSRTHLYISQTLKHNRSHPLSKETCQSIVEITWAIGKNFAFLPLHISISVTSQMQNNNFIFRIFITTCSTVLAVMSSLLWSYTMCCISTHQGMYSMNCTCFMEKSSAIHDTDFFYYYFSLDSTGMNSNFFTFIGTRHWFSSICVYIVARFAVWLLNLSRSSSIAVKTERKEVWWRHFVHQL